MMRSARTSTAALLLSACSQPGSGYPANGSSGSEANETIAATPTAVPASTAVATPAPAETRARTAPAKHETIVNELHDMLVGTATLDGAAISDIRRMDACHTRFVTSKGDVTIDWTKGGNIAPRNVYGHEINDLPGVDGNHSLSAPNSIDVDGVSGAVGLLVSECAPGF